MIRFLANVIDQLDLALDQIILNDPNYNRFALMLIDNAMELTLHRIAEDLEAENTMFARIMEPRHNPKIVAEALGQRFDAKVKLARSIGLLTDIQAGSILTLHTYRNQVYHRGLQNEPILGALASFYLRVASEVLSKYRPRSYSISSSDRIPYRARKYIGSEPFMKADMVFSSAYRRLGEVSEAIPFNLVGDLYGQMKRIIDDVDISLDFISMNAPQRLSRDAVIVEVQAWSFAFSEKGKAYAEAHGATYTSADEYADWFVQNYSWSVRADPIAAWNGRLSSLASEVDPHKALRKYHEFMSQTEDLREKINEAALQLDMQIQQQIDIARGK